MRASPSLRVRFCLDISRKLTDTSLSSEIVRRFALDFRKKHWPWPELPELFYFPRALGDTPNERASLHAKCVVIDRQAALVTSANFTQAAQEKKIEVGVLIRDTGFVTRLVGYFDGLVASGVLQPCRL
jgi:phosphatidylserine/phosphatidylglycerophosphate/cardiolipin synthase-like enzyme